MKTAFAVVGGIAALLFLVLAGFIGYGVYTGVELNKSSRAYIEANVPPILTSWSEDALLKNSSPQLLKAVTESSGPSLHQMFSQLSALGALRTLKELKGSAKFGYTSWSGKTATAEYVADADFENGKASLTIRLIQVDGQWRFLGFFVNPPRNVHPPARRQT